MSLKAVLATNLVYKVANVTLVFFITALLSRAMGVQGFGRLSLLLLNCTLFNLFTSFGSDSAITYVVAADKKQTPASALGFILLIVCGQLLLMIGIEGICSFLFHRSLLVPLHVSFAWALAIALLTAISLQEKIGALLAGADQYTEMNRLGLFSNLFSLVLLGLFFVLITERFSAAYEVFFVFSYVLAALVLFVAAIKQFGFSLAQINTAVWSRTFFRYSSLAFLANLVQFFAYRVDMWMIAYFRNETELGWYALAVRLVQLFWLLPALIAGIVFPKVSTAKKRFDHEELLPVLRLLNTAYLLAGVAVFFLVRPLLLFFFGQAYAQSILPFQLLLPGVICFSNVTVLAAYFAGQDQLAVNLRGSVLCFLLVGGLDLLLIPRYGYVGAAVASSLGYALTTLYIVVLYCRRENRSFRQVLILKKNDLRQLAIFRKTVVAKFS